MRLDEMRESLYTMKQCVDKLSMLELEGDTNYICADDKLVPPTRRSMKTFMNH